MKDNLEKKDKEEKSLDEQDIQIVKKANKSNHKIVLLIISILGFTLIVVGVYFLFIKENGQNSSNDDEIQDNNSNNQYIVYKFDDGKELKLLETDSDYSSYTKYKTYKLIINNKEYVAYSDRDDSNNHLIVYTENSIYLLEKGSKEVLAHYENSKRIGYEKIDYDDKEILWYAIYLDGDLENVIMIINTKIGQVLNFENNRLDEYFFENGNIYLQYGNKIEQYDADGKKVVSKNYSKVIDFKRGVVQKSNELYQISYDNFKENKLNKSTYKDDKNILNVYKLNYQSYDLDYIAEYNGVMIDMNYDSDDNDYSKDDIYAIYSGTREYAQSNEYNFLVNKKTGKLEKYSTNGLGIIKSKNGYYFTEEGGDIALDPPSYVYTTNWVKLGTYIGATTDDDGNIYVSDGKVITKYDINGKELLSYNDYDTVCCAIVYNNLLYIIAEENKKTYFVDIANNIKLEINNVTGLPGYMDISDDGFIIFDIPDKDGEYVRYCYEHNEKKLKIIDNE